MEAFLVTHSCICILKVMSWAISSFQNADLGMLKSDVGVCGICHFPSFHILDLGFFKYGCWEFCDLWRLKGH